MRKIVELISNILKKFNIAVIRYSTLLNYRKCRKSDLALNYLRYLKNIDISQFLFYLEQSKSQALQDIVVLALLDFQENGFFVEFGATDGVFLSNTFLLEKKKKWAGILSEPSKVQNKNLKINRSCNLDYRCVWSKSGEKITFSEAKLPHLSTINFFKKSDQHKNLRKNSCQYQVETISLEKLLDNFNAPKHIQFLSIDTEGSEHEILKEFDFSKYSFSILLVEHNFTKKRDLIYRLLSKNGYLRVFDYISDVDDWYVSKNIFDEKIKTNPNIY